MKEFLKEYPIAGIIIGVVVGFLLCTGISSTKKTTNYRHAHTQYIDNFARIPQSEYGTVYITQYGKKYHRKRCSVIRQASKVRQVAIEDAKKAGMEPCSRCH